MCHGWCLFKGLATNGAGRGSDSGLWTEGTCCRRYPWRALQGECRCVSEGWIAEWRCCMRAGVVGLVLALCCYLFIRCCVMLLCCCTWTVCGVAVALCWCGGVAVPLRCCCGCDAVVVLLCCAWCFCGVVSVVADSGMLALSVAAAFMGVPFFC